jgi:hypothetical protein
MAGHSRSKNGVAPLAYVPAIQALLRHCPKDVDARNNCGHDVYPRNRAVCSGAQAYGIRDKAAKPRPAAPHRRGRRFDTAEALQQPAHGHLRLHARKRHPGTGVNAGAEGEMPVRLPVDVEAIGIGELLRVAIGGADADVHVTSGLDRNAAQRRVLNGPTIAKLVRTFYTQKFLDRRLNRVRVIAQITHRVRMANQKIDGVADEVGRRLVTGVEKKNAIMDQFELSEVFVVVRLSDIVARINEFAENFRRIVMSGSQPIGNNAVQIVFEFRHRGDAGVELLPAEYGLERAEDRERPCAQRFALVVRDTEHVADQLHRNGGGKIRDHVDLAFFGRCIEQSIDQILDPVLQRV